MAAAAKVKKAPLSKAEKQAKNAARFVKVATKRVRKAIKAIALVGQCSNRASYSYTDADVKKISDAIAKAATDALTRFRVAPEAKEDAGFSL